MFDKGVRILAGAPFKSKLQHPNKLHVGNKAALNGKLGRLRGDHFFGSRVKRHRSCRTLIACRRLLIGVPALFHLRPQKRGKQERGRNLFTHGDTLVSALEREHQKLLAVGLIKNDIEHRQKRTMQARSTQFEQTLFSAAARKELDHFVEKSSCRHIAEQRRHFRNGSIRTFFNLETQLGRNTHGTHHAHRVLSIARLRITDHAQRLASNVLVAPVIIVNVPRRRIVVKRIDRKVATRSVLPHLPENVVGNDAAGSILANSRSIECSECRTFNDFVAEHHMHQTETTSDDESAALSTLDLFGSGISGHIEVFGLDPEQQITHSAAHNVGFVAALLQN